MKPIKLHPVNHSGATKNRYCGPAAISILTGLDTGRAATLLRRISGRRFIKSASTYSVIKALRELGIGAVPLPTAAPTPTLVQWLRQVKPAKGATYLLVVGNHYAVVQGRRYVCGLTEKSVPFKLSPKRRARVTEVFGLIRYDSPHFDNVVAPVKRSVDIERKPRQEAKALAAQWGIEVEEDRHEGHRLLWVYPPKVLHDEHGEMPDDPYCGDHAHDDWTSALEAVKTYVEAIKARNISASNTLALAQPSVDVTTQDCQAAV